MNLLHQVMPEMATSDLERLDDIIGAELYVTLAGLSIAAATFLFAALRNAKSDLSNAADGFTTQRDAIGRLSVADLATSTDVQSAVTGTEATAAEFRELKALEKARDELTRGADRGDVGSHPNEAQKCFIAKRDEIGGLSVANLATSDEVKNAATGAGATAADFRELEALEKARDELTRGADRGDVGSHPNEAQKSFIAKRVKIGGLSVANLATSDEVKNAVTESEATAAAIRELEALEKTRDELTRGANRGDVGSHPSVAQEGFIVKRDEIGGFNVADLATSDEVKDAVTRPDAMKAIPKLHQLQKRRCALAAEFATFQVARTSAVLAFYMFMTGLFFTLGLDSYLDPPDSLEELDLAGTGIPGLIGLFCLAWAARALLLFEPGKQVRNVLERIPLVGISKDQ